MSTAETHFYWFFLMNNSSVTPFDHFGSILCLQDDMTKASGLQYLQKVLGHVSMSVGQQQNCYGVLH
jgi:hypothetical protein